MNEKQTIKCNLVGYYHFTSKDKSKTYYVLQLLKTDEDERNNKRCSLKDIFVDEEVYTKVVRGIVDIGVSVDVEVSINTQTDKVYYKVVI